MKYLTAIMDDNRFLCNMKAKFENKFDEDVDIEVIIDTGCAHSHISADLIYIFLSDEERLKTKDKWIKSKRFKGIGHGVESANKQIDYTIDINNERVMVYNGFFDISINGVDIGNRALGVSYDTSKIALIGMGILKDFDIHIGTSKILNKVILLACPKDRLNKEYYRALNDHFSLGDDILAASILS